MTVWIVSCDSCPYRQRFQNQSQTHQELRDMQPRTRTTTTRR
jgi:hypothetical protein